MTTEDLRELRDAIINPLTVISSSANSDEKTQQMVFMIANYLEKIEEIK